MFKPKEILSQLDCLRVLKTLDVPINGNTTLCPVCRKDTLVFNRDSLTCINNQCEFISGNIVDYIVLYRSCTYKEAVRYLIERFQDSMIGISAYDPNYVIDSVAATLEHQREIFNNIFKLRTNYDLIDKFRLVPGYFRKRGWEAKAITRSVLFGKKSEIKEICELLNNEEYEDFIEEGTDYLIFPYMSGYDSIGVLKIYNIETGKHLKISLSPCSVNYLGLLESSPNTLDFRIYSKEEDTLKLQSFYFDKLDRNTCCIFPLKDSALASPVKLNVGLYVWEMDSDIKDVSRLKHLFKEVKITGHELEGKSGTRISWDDFSFAIVTRKLKSLKGKLDQETVDLINFLDLPKHITEKIRNWLIENNLSNLLSIFDNNTVVNKTYNIGAGSVLVTPYGYHFQPKNSTDVIPFTNFVVDFDSCLTFHTSNDTYYEGKLITAGKFYPVSIDRKDFAKPLNIETSVQQDFKNAQTSFRVQDVLPMITNTMYGKYLPHILNLSAANAKTNLGIETLGYNERNGSYKTVYKIYDALGSDSILSRFHPGKKIFNLYSNRLFIEEDFYSDIFVDKFLCIIMGMIARSIMDMEIKSIRVNNTIHAKKLLKAIYRAFGQSSIYDINPNNRGAVKPNIEGLNGYPILSSCTNEEKAATMTLPSIILTGDGIDVTSEKILSDKEYNGITSYSFDIINKSLEWLMKCNLAELQNRFSQYCVTNIETEGMGIIQSAIGKKIFSDGYSTLPKFVAILFKVGENVIKQNCYFDFINQKCIISFKNAKLQKLVNIAISEFKKNDVIYELDNENKLLSIENDLFNNCIISSFGFPIELKPFELENKKSRNSSVKKSGTN